MQMVAPREILAWLKALGEHWNNARLSRPRLVAKQQKKFRKLVAFVAENSPFYGDIIRRRGIDPSSCRPEDFPELTKDRLNENFDRIVTNPRITRQRISEFLAQSSNPTDLLDGAYHVLHTSGTTGTLGYFVYSHDEWIRGSSHSVRMGGLGFRKRVAYVAATRGHFAGVSLALTGNHGTNALFYNVRPFDVNTPLTQLVRALNDFQPRVLSGYAAILKVLGEAQERGHLQVKPALLGSGGEPMPPEVRSYLERVFQAPVADVYASSEHLHMGLGFPGTDGMYLMEDDLIFELHDDHICVTNLFNYTTPLIRYRMDDVLIPETNGRRIYPFTKIKGVIGRYEDVLTFTNKYGLEDFIHPIVIVELVIKGLNAWQVVLLNDSSFLFKARFETSLGYDEKRAARARLNERLEAILAEKDMDNVRFHVQEVDALPVDERTGKFRLVVRNGQATLAANRYPGPHKVFALAAV